MEFNARKIVIACSICQKVDYEGGLRVLLILSFKMGSEASDSWINSQVNDAFLFYDWMTRDGSSAWRMLIGISGE